MPAKKATADKQPAKKTPAKRSPQKKAATAATARASPAPRPADKPGEAVRAPAQKKEPARPAQRRVAAKPTLLGSAAEVLAKAKEPLTTKAIMEEIDRLGLWKSPKGMTPQSTLYAGMLREIARKGSASRFAKVDRGLFTLRTKEEA